MPIPMSAGSFVRGEHRGHSPSARCDEFVLRRCHAAPGVQRESGVQGRELVMMSDMVKSKFPT